MLSKEDVLRAVGPLRLVFWGGLICVFDFKINGFDLLNDAAGMVMVAVGVSRLAGTVVNARYEAAMSFVRVVAVLAVIVAVVTQLPFNPGPLGSFGFQVFGLVELAAIVVFCVAMRWFCEEAELAAPAASWRTTTLLFVIIYAVPLGVLYCASALAILTGESFNIQLGPAGLVLLPVFFIPLIHLFVSTSRMASHTRDAGVE